MTLQTRNYDFTGAYEKSSVSNAENIKSRRRFCMQVSQTAGFFTIFDQK